MTSNGSTQRPLSFPPLHNSPPAQPPRPYPSSAARRPCPATRRNRPLTPIHHHRQWRQQRVDRRLLPAGRMAIDRSPDPELRRCVTTSLMFRLTTSGKSVRAPIWSGRSTTPPPPTSAMRAILCRPRCNTFRRPPSKNSNTPPTLLSTRRTIRQRSNATIILTWASRGKSPRPGRSPGTRSASWPKTCSTTASSAARSSSTISITRPARFMARSWAALTNKGPFSAYGNYFLCPNLGAGH